MVIQTMMRPSIIFLPNLSALSSGNGDEEKDKVGKKTPRR
jgi:hypothetical protein